MKDVPPQQFARRRKKIQFLERFILSEYEAMGEDQTLRPSCLLGLLLCPEDGSSMLLRNVSKLLPDYMEAHPRRQQSSNAELLALFLFAFHVNYKSLHRL
jgi:hypothetical protein